MWVKTFCATALLIRYLNCSGDLDAPSHTATTRGCNQWPLRVKRWVKMLSHPGHNIPKADLQWQLDLSDWQNSVVPVLTCVLPMILFANLQINHSTDLSVLFTVEYTVDPANTGSTLSELQAHISPHQCYQETWTIAEKYHRPSTMSVPTFLCQCCTCSDSQYL